MYSYHHHHLSIIIPLCFFLHQQFFSVATSSSPGLYHLLDNVAVNCGSTGNSTAVDGRQWVGDIGSKHINSHGSKGKLISSKATDQPLSPHLVPYMTARLSRWPFTYTFRVTPGQKFVRLHFYPTSYRGFKRSKAFFTVKFGPYTLLSHFSASLAADVLGTQSVVKEYCVYVGENEPLILTFSPSLGGSDDDVYAFVNGIEIISIPAGLYHTSEGNPAAHVVGTGDRFTLKKSIAFEKVHRLNVGGISISPMEDTGMFRDWSEDSNYLLQSSVQPVATTIRVKYTSIPSYAAPQKVYQTSWSMAPDKKANNTFNFTWKLPVDLGFRYLLRFHFCELEYEINESGHTEFSILVNEQVAESKADLIKWSGGIGVALYRDYVVMMEGDRMEGKRDLLIAFYPHKHEGTEHIDGILKGLEIFKLSNPDKNLAGVNLVLLARASKSNYPKPRKLVFASGGNAFATGVVILLTIMSIIVYQLRILGENTGEKNLSPSPSQGLCRQFSLAEIQSVTNNFDDKLVIGRGGFGKVYKALIDDGTTAVALKRLNLKSKQGANEFWTEIEMLSNLRHTHLVSLIGYCDERDEMILVYEYMEHGTLADHLYKIKTSGNGAVFHMSWEQRMNMCIGAARGLDYLHTGTRHGIIHRDVKTTNILLDEDWVAKISDFGLSKVGATSRSRTHVSTDVKGTFGYLDPEYFLTRRLTKKSDVYAFGVVMLEMLCGRPAVDTRIKEEQRSLILWAQQCIKEKTLDQIVDPSLKDQISPQCLKAFADLATKCLHNTSNGRPTMADVVVSLEYAMSSKDQSRVLSTKLEDQDGDDDFNVGGDDSLPRGTIPFPSTPVQYNENTQGQKRSKGKLSVVFLRSVEFLTKRGDNRQKKRKDFDSNSEQLHLDYGSNSRRLQWINATLPYRRFLITEIRAATNNFDDHLLIEEGGFSKVYKGLIDHGTLQVAVKQLKASASEESYMLRAEIQTQSQLRHLHIVPLIGYCVDEGAPMLVYKYMVNRSLHNHLYPMESGFHDPLPWKKRLEICIGAARGLQYLHSGTTHTITHRNIKPSKILLDENFVAKVSDFDLAKVLPREDTGVITRVCGSIGYLDPEYTHCGHLTEKSDVYSFGMVLLEVLCGRRPYDPSLEQEQRPLVRWFRTSVRRKKIDQTIDPYLVGRISPECLREFVKIAWKCVMDKAVERPSMDDVVGSLQIALQLQQKWHNGSELDSASPNDPGEEEWSRFAVARAYNDVLPDDSAFEITDTGLKLHMTVSISPVTSNTTSPDGNNISGNRQISASSGSSEVYPTGQILPTPIRIYSFLELKNATRNFRPDTILGEGGFGTVYKGWLDEKVTSKKGSGSVVAIKKLHSESMQGLQEWKSEVNFLGTLSHPNLVKLFGYCWEDRELLLVYEFMARGSLENHLFRRGAAVQPLPWDTRLKILIGAARGVGFLHTSEKQVIYRDFKASNILLDVSYDAKISDFGLAKLGPSADQSHVTTRVMGTYGYAAPEYVATGHLSVKSDVYGFGVVLLEMLTGLRVLDTNRPSGQQNLVDWGKPYLSDRRKLKKIMDTRLEEKYPNKAALQIAQLALKCLEADPKRRPSMKEVVEKLECIDAIKTEPKARQKSALG